jgi:hypothetical protein
MSQPLTAIKFLLGDAAYLESELRAGLEHFWQLAANLFNNSSITLKPPCDETFALSRNFFSTLFLYSYYRVGVPPERRILYVAVNQCLRGMVTGCDNILDDEYKPTLETDLPEKAHRFRSILDIMVADRVLFALLTAYCRAQRLPDEVPLRASAASLQALTQSGAQEASEEGGIGSRLPPDVILQKVHHYKTGVLFQATWAIPSLLEEQTAVALTVQQALYHIGIGCQLLDDIVDLFTDMRDQRHNYVASAILHGGSSALQQDFHSRLATEESPRLLYAAWPDFAGRMQTLAMSTLKNGLHGLFLQKHREFITPAARFIAQRIGVPLEQ